MRKNEIEVGGVYTAKVSGKVVPVKITADRGMVMRLGFCFRDPINYHAGWVGVNQETGREIHIHSAARLRAKYHKPRCGQCGNCLVAIEEKKRWTERYREVVDSGRPTSQSEMANMRSAWVARVEALPCTGGAK